MQNLKFKTCIINGQERYIFATIDKNEQTMEMNPCYPSWILT